MTERNRGSRTTVITVTERNRVSRTTGGVVLHKNYAVYIQSNEWNVYCTYRQASHQKLQNIELQVHMLSSPSQFSTVFIILVLCWEDTNYTETTPNTARRSAVLLTNVLINLATSKLSKIS